jgi:hypothetical protein
MTIRFLPNKRPIAADMRITTVFALATALGSCAQQPRDQDYARSVLDRPLPTAKESALQECAFLDSEIIRQQNAARFVPQDQLLPETALTIQKATQTNIAALKLRASQLACPPRPMGGSDRTAGGAPTP